MHLQDLPLHLGESRRLQLSKLIGEGAPLEEIARGLGDNFEADLPPAPWETPAIRAHLSVNPLEAKLTQFRSQGRWTELIRTAKSRAVKHLGALLLIEVIDSRIQALYQLHLGDSQRSHDFELSLIELQTKTRGAVEALLQSIGLNTLAAMTGQPADWFRVQLSYPSGMPTTRLNFRFTHHCNIQCRHCYNSSGPDRKTDLFSRERMMQLIAQAGTHGIEVIRLTGGEPFLYREHLLDAIAAARSQGLGFQVCTNAFWAKSVGAALKVLETLSEAGFDPREPHRDYIKASCGIYHDEQGLGLKNCAYLALAHWQTYEEPVQLDYESHQPTPRGRDYAMERLAEYGVQPKHVRLNVRQLSAVGRASEEIDDGWEAQTLEHASFFGPCTTMTSIAINSDGSSVPCCGFNEGSLGIRVGNANTSSLPELLRAKSNNPLLQFISRHSIDELAPYLDRAFAMEPTTSICHACSNSVGDMGGAPLKRIKQALSSTMRYYPHFLMLEEVHSH